MPTSVLYSIKTIFLYYRIVYIFNVTKLHGSPSVNPTFHGVLRQHSKFLPQVIFLAPRAAGGSMHVQPLLSPVSRFRPSQSEALPETVRGEVGPRPGVSGETHRARVCAMLELQRGQRMGEIG